MKVQTIRFGEIDVPDGDVFTFPEGLLGFADLRIYALLPHPKGGPVGWLQSAEVPSLAFPVADPACFSPEYTERLRREDPDLKDASDALFRVILTVPKDPLGITVNLRGPLVLNRRARTGKQVVLSDPGLSTRHRMFAEAT